jgi:metal-responsive CopG/Arc/MetJ family transcriptional regulator
MSYRVAVCVRVDRRLLERFDDRAGQEGYTRSEAMREAIRRFARKIER